MDIFMAMIQNMKIGFGVALSFDNLAYCFLGCLVGTVVGVLPGIGPLATLSLLLPLTFKISSVSSIIMLAGIFYGAMYGGSTTSILVNIPGEAASVVTCLDGYQMARQGRAGPALGIAAFGSFIAGTIGNMGLNFFSPFLVQVALEFGPPEYFALMCLGFIVCMYMVGGSIIKALLMIALGVFVASIGMEIVRGEERFTYDIVYLMQGFGLVPVFMGMFGVSEILLNIETIAVKREVFSAKIRNLLPNRKDWRESFWPIIRGSFVGFGLGTLPGGGPTTAAFLSYAVERKVSRNPEKFGSGAIEGVAGPESANNSAVAASMIPLMSLGIPGNAVTALLMGALIIHGVQPGPMLMSTNPDIFWGVIASMYVGNVMLLILNLPLISVWVQVLKIPYRFLFPIIFLLCVIGSFSESLETFDIWAMIGFGVLGFFLRKAEYELAPFALALVLTPLLERALRQSLILSQQNPIIFLTRPISAFLVILSLVLLAAFVISERRKRKKLRMA